jgi:hypothetical protein
MIMRTKTQTTAIVICFAVLSMQFISCKKENVSAISNAGSVDLAVQTVGKANLVAWYKFTKGYTVDYSGHNNHLLPHNVTLATDYMGRPDNAYYFNGYSSFMQAANSSSLNPSKITLAALIKPTGLYTGTGAASRILMKGVDDQSNGDYFLGFYNTGSFYGAYGNNQYQSNGVAGPANFLQLNNWYKLVYTYNGSVGKLYINDVLAGQSNKIATFTPNTSPLRIGKTGRTDYPYWFNGVIDEIRIYNIALNAAQVVRMESELGQ